MPILSTDKVTICFAHPAYQLAAELETRNANFSFVQAWSRDEISIPLADADVLVISAFWSDSLLDIAPNLKFIQSIGAGYNQFPLEELKERGIPLASAQGTNKFAVADHALAHILSFARHMHTGRDNQNRRHWRGMIANLDQREDELQGKTLLIVGMGDIGSRVAKLAKAFDMTVIGSKRNPATAQGPADEVITPDQLLDHYGRADYVLLTCPLTPETTKIVDAATFAAMKPSAYLINMARGACVDEAAMLAALQSGSIAGAGLDILVDEPLPEDSPFWAMENVIITPHTGGETVHYERNLIDILVENIRRLQTDESLLVNQIV